MINTDLIKDKKKLIKKIIVKSIILICSIVGCLLYFSNFFDRSEGSIIAGMFFIGPVLLCILPIFLIIIFVKLVSNVIDYISVNSKIKKASIVINENTK